MSGMLRFLWAGAFCAVGLAPMRGIAEVYKWEDSSGGIHYSNKPPSKSAKPAELPPIMRGEVKVPVKKLVTCEQHGGVNCKLGPDKDGSVLCYDNFRESNERYTFVCNSPKLEISDISEVDENGAFTVFVRNTKSVAANEAALIFKLPSGKQEKLKGPREIDAFGIGEFGYEGGDPKEIIREQPTIADLTITCANCP